ncbi:cutinase family protein [Mycolicibacterium arenosum]|uniref:Cutinase n=1 Tax=Mycolicibacterium arenosum TaxID=2952157 RepID=A0ABT1M5Y3_9MYCO|nr:cutinase family protein [Mycolicibacterium sp. CAU 1645]MCP9274564.1 cutinase family protein [Mycolicibacterium sp. CAU 1645]
MLPQCGRSSQATNRRSAGRWVGRSAAVLTIVAVQLVTPNAVPVASAADCADAEVIFARGTDEPEGMGAVGDAFADSLRKQAVGLNIATYAVDYDAGKLQLGSGDGAKDAIKRIKATAASCPETKIVLGGYSQGANVVNIVAGNPIVGIAWGASLPSSFAANVAAIATFGNVANRSGTKLPSQSAMFAGKGIDLCNPADPICHAGPGNEWSGHTDGYVPSYTTQAAAFVASKLSAGTGQAVPGVGPSTGYGQLPGPASEAPVYASPPLGSDHMPPGWDASASTRGSQAPGYGQPPGSAAGQGIDPSILTGLP